MNREFTSTPDSGMVDFSPMGSGAAALHRQLARQSANGTYFLSCRDAAKACLVLNKDSANAINRALEQLGVLSMVKIGEMRAGGYI